MNRLRIPDIVAGIAGIVLLVSLFLPWYEVLGVEVTATEAFGFVDIFLLATALMGIALPLVTMARETPALPIAIDVLTWWVALLTTLMVVFRTLNLPGPDGVGRAWGLWVGLLATLGVLAGAHRAMRDQSAPGLKPNPEPELKPAPPS